jgi:hypothetical protein
MVAASLRRAPAIVAAGAAAVVDTYDCIFRARDNSTLPSVRYKAVATGPNATPKPTRTARKTAVLALAACLALLGAIGVAASYWHDSLSRHGAFSPASSLDLSRGQFIDTILREPVEGHVDPAPIRKKCAATKFQEGLVWHCQELTGGIGNANSIFLNCVRYAIEAGATTLILPRISPRDTDDLYNFGTNDTIDLSRLFDVDHFLDSWQTACPQMRVVVSDSELAGDMGLGPIDEALELRTASVKEFNLIRGLTIVDPTGWREAFDAWCVAQPACEKASAAHPVRVWQLRALFQWNNLVDEPDFVRNFARLFRLPRETRTLAASALWDMQGKLNRPIIAKALVRAAASNTSTNSGFDSGSNNLVSSLFNSPPSHEPQLVSDGFFGAHLRVAADAVKAGWPGYDAQTPYYIKEARNHSLDSIYLASGSPSHIEQFRKEAEGFKVYTKQDLLDDSDRALLEDMTWDRQALVDLDVLMYSSYFYGFVRSSFSWQLAIRRATVPGSGHERVGDALPKQDSFRDNITALTGHHNVAFEKAIWP